MVDQTIGRMLGKVEHIKRCAHHSNSPLEKHSIVGAFSIGLARRLLSSWKGACVVTRTTKSWRVVASICEPVDHSVAKLAAELLQFMSYGSATASVIATPTPVATVPSMMLDDGPCTIWNTRMTLCYWQTLNPEPSTVPQMQAFLSGIEQVAADYAMNLNSEKRKRSYTPTAQSRNWFISGRVFRWSSVRTRPQVKCSGSGSMASWSKSFEVDLRA